MKSSASPRTGLTLMELVIALFVVGLIVAFAIGILRDQNSNMIHVRSRVQSQTAARDGLKILESELRAAGFGVSWSLKDPANRTLEISTVGDCPALDDATLGSSVVAMDGANGGPDTLDIAFPTTVDPSTGTTCASAIWSRYVLVAGDLQRYSAATRGALVNATPTVVGRNVDVFQVQLGTVGISKAGTMLLKTDSCCTTAGASVWSGTYATSSVGAATRTDTLRVSGTWSFLSPARSLSAGETWRASVTVDLVNTPLLSDLGTNAATSYVQLGLFPVAAGDKAVTFPILSRPSVAIYNFGIPLQADFTVPKSGMYRLGLKGVTAASGGWLVLRSFDALSVRLGADSTWYHDPGDLKSGDWVRAKGVRVVILTSTHSDKKDYATKFTGLANFRQATGAPLGEYLVKDTAVRVLLDHTYPAGNNGSF